MFYIFVYAVVVVAWITFYLFVGIAYGIWYLCLGFYWLFTTGIDLMFDFFDKDRR